MGYECLEPDYLALEIGSVVKFQIDFLLGEYVVELVYVTCETHQVAGDIIRCPGGIVGKQSRAEKKQCRNQVNKAFHGRKSTINSDKMEHKGAKKREPFCEDSRFD